MRTRTLFPINFDPHLLVGLLLVICLVAGACGSTSTVGNPVGAPGTTDFTQHLQSQLAAKMQEMHVPGAVIFVQSARTGSWVTNLGTSNIATHAPMNPDLYFRIGSITKTLTGTVILQLVDQGKLRLDDPVAKYQPEVPNGGHITLRELLDMRSGLYNYSEDDSFGQALEAHPNRVWTPQELIAISFKHPPYFAPGQDFHYSNTNFILLGMIIEQITGHPVEYEFQQRIFTPLGMTHSLLPPRPSTEIPAPYAHGYMFNTPAISNDEINESTQNLADVTIWNPSWGWTAGSAISTLHDLEIWAKALASGKLLSPATQKERLTWTTTIASDKYGL
ncbi:MAG TPA: serine hydrolase domain-containing protein, partial [Ktedonobacteraceae bacterium]|nr:serine hydrolase domain-containing protein [Ktedonobacteraceae bacterium]